VCFNRELVEINAPENDAGICWRGHQTNSTAHARVEADAAYFNGTLDRGLQHLPYLILA
jgi:hypothetical protein